jgi:spoIIIJ-associated protein
MVSIEKTAKTAEEAIQLALAELGVPRERAQVEILEQGRPLFGILGSSQVRVRVTAQPTIGGRAARVLMEMLGYMGIAATAEVIEEDEQQAVIDIRGEELGLLIGKHGQTLAAVQHLLGLMVNKGEETRKRIILDAQGYRERREESLRHLALASARRAKQTGEPVTLDPLLPHERRIIHTALADDPDVTTRSIGEEPTRRIVIEPRGGGDQGAGRDSRLGPRDQRRYRDRAYPRREPREAGYGAREDEGFKREDEESRAPADKPEPEDEERKLGAAGEERAPEVEEPPSDDEDEG